MYELEWHKEVHEIVLPKFDKEYKEACVTEGGEVLTLCPEEEEHRSSMLTQIKCL